MRKLLNCKIDAFLAGLLLTAGTFGMPSLVMAQDESEKPKVCSEILQKSKGNLTAELKKAYPSCANWLSRACLSSFRLDQSTPLTQLLLQDDSLQGQPCLDCDKPQVSSIGSSTKSLASLMDSLKGAADPYLPQKYQAEVVKVTLDHWHMINEKRNHDLNVILSYFDKEEIPKEMRNASVRGAIRTLGERVSGASERAGDQEKVSFQKFVAAQIADAGEDIPVQWVDENGVQQSDFYYGFYSRLKEETSDRDRFKLLVQRAKKVDTGVDEEFDGNLTPYHSKMILLYHLENSIREKYSSEPVKAESLLNELAGQLQLKADYSGKGKSSEWKWIIPHDGFVLGATNSQINNLLKKGSLAGSSGSGVDCATFVHKMLLGGGYSVLKNVGRMTSAGIATGGQVKSIANIERISSATAANIGPGDLIIKRPKNDPVGHVEIVVGFEGDPPQIVTVSAEGGYQRSIIKRKHDIYPNQPHSCGTDNYFSESESRFYRAVLKRGP